jgi:hypothetical protein
MKKLHLVTGHLQKLHEKPVYTLAAMSGTKTLRTWEFGSEKERAEFLRPVGKGKGAGTIEFSDDDLAALGINPKTLM